jgi:hypothetical protein
MTQDRRLDIRLPCYHTPGFFVLPIYLGTFSKILFPALRLAYLVLPESLVEPVTAAKAIIDTGTATLEQLALADWRCCKNSLATQDIVENASSFPLYNVVKIFFATQPLFGDARRSRRRPTQYR